MLVVLTAIHSVSLTAVLFATIAVLCTNTEFGGIYFISAYPGSNSGICNRFGSLTSKSSFHIMFDTIPWDLSDWLTVSEWVGECVSEWVWLWLWVWVSEWEWECESASASESEWMSLFLLTPFRVILGNTKVGVISNWLILPTELWVNVTKTYVHATFRLKGK